MFRYCQAFIPNTFFVKWNFNLTQHVKMIVIKMITVTQQCQYVISFTHYISNGLKVLSNGHSTPQNCELYKLLR